MTELTKHLRPIRSFVRREGRMTDAQRDAIARLWQEFAIECHDEYLNFQAIFANANEVILEIGFGHGENIIELARNNPHKNYLGIDVHRPGAGAVLLGIEKFQIKNLRIICHDAKEVLEKNISDNSLSEVLLFFPDPWPKKRHHKRRLLQNDFVQLIRKKLKTSGTFYMATDWQDYAEHMLAVMNQAEGFKNLSESLGFTERYPSRPLTKFERRGHRLGHEVWDLGYAKVS